MSTTRIPSVATIAALSLILFAGANPADADDREGRENRRAMRFIELFDTSGDGKVTVKEITADQGRLFGAVDVDGDKALSVDEFRRRGRLFRIYATTTLFDLLDANGDRKLTADEISAPSQRWFKRYDGNNDGVMAADEVPAGRWHRMRRGRSSRH